MPLEPGTRLGDYEVLSSLGAGGMGEVYRAKDLKLGREVAIKILLEEVSQDPERLARFEREAKVLASLNHSNIATLYGFESDGDKQFLVMEVVEGETLADRIRRGAIPVEEALPLFLQIAEGLEAAHEKGVIHRDLKPANIKVSDEGQASAGRVKILDFGLAKAMAVDVAESGEASRSMSPTLTLAATQRGEILGTAAYMSPEQARGQPVDKRADIWAFGVCLFETLAGERVFEGEDASITLASVLKSDPDWQRLPDETPRKLRDLLRRCLRKDPRQRLRDIGDARIEIEEAMATPEGDEPRFGAVAAEKRSPVPLALAALAAGAVVAGIAVWTLKPAPALPERRVVRSVLSAAPSAPIDGIGNPFDRDLAMTPDGRMVVYKSGGSLYVRPVDRLGGYQLEGTEGAGRPFLSPDGAWVGFESGGTLKKVSILGGPTVTLCELPNVLLGASWGAHDTIVFGLLNEGLYRVSGGGGEAEALVAPDPERGQVSYRFPEVLPGGEAVVFTVFTTANVEQAQIVVHSFATGESKVLVSGGAGARYVSTGHLVYGLSGTLRAVAFDAKSLEVRGNPVPVLEGVNTKTLGAVDFDVSQDGSLVYVAGGRTGGMATLVWVERDGREEALSAPPRPYLYPRISPDGQRVGVSISDEDQDVWIWDLGRENLERLTLDPATDIYALWTRDSREVVFASFRGGSMDLYRRAADGTGEVSRLSESPDNLLPSSMSPDDKLLVYRVDTGAAPDLGVLSLEDEGVPEPLLTSEFGERNGEISPDGRWLAYQSDESGEDRIYVRPFPDVDGGRFSISAGGGTEPLWSRDGKELFYRTQDGAMMTVPVETDPGFRAGSPERIFEGRYLSFIGRNYDIAPDGQRFLMVKPVERAEGDPGDQVIMVENWFEELKRLVPTD